MNEPQRILFLAEINSTHTERWVISLIEKGFSVALFSLSQKTKSWPDEIDNFKYHCYGISTDQTSSNRRFGKMRYFAAQKEVKKFYDSFQPDIVHAHYASSYGTLARQLGHVRTVLSLWGSDVYVFPKRSPLHKFLFKRAVKFAKVVCSTSEDMARESRQYVDREYVITPFGVDMGRFVPSKNQAEDSTIVIGTLKMLEEVYGIDRLIKTYKQFTEKVDYPSRLDIFGRGTQKEALEQLIRELDLGDRVTLKGFVSGDELIQAYQSLDVFASLSRRESFGVATLEAQACGALAMVTNVGGLPEVTSPETGKIVNEGEEEKWVDELIQLCEDARDQKLREQARLFVDENFSDRICVEKLIEVYRNV